LPTRHTTSSQGKLMNQSIQSSTNGVAFRRPTFHRNVKRFFGRVMRNLTWYSRAKVARALVRHGYHEQAKNLLEDNWK
jgi:hypothetical protein